MECWVPDHQLCEEDIDHLCVGLNLNQGQFDYDVLANAWDPLNLVEWGFTEEQLLGLAKVTEEIIEEEKKSKQKLCPNCGQEL